MEIKNNYKIWSFILIFLSWSSFFLGFYLDENSAGAGTYKGDWIFLWSNLQIFLNNDVSEAINHENFLTNRSPLLYILHKLFNPFVENKISYRKSVFIISLATPIIFYLCLKQKFKGQDNLLLFLAASTILLSPYYRTSSFWGLEENYGFISLLLAFLFLNFFLENDGRNDFKSYFQLFFSIFFSSVCIYFDQKLLVIPIICFLTIINSRKKIKFKIFSIFLYLILSLPYVYLIMLWGGIFPTNLTQSRDLGNKLYFDHIGYTSTIISFYLFPFLFFKGKNFFILIKNFFLKKGNYYYISLFFIYSFYLLISSHFFGQSFLNIDISLGKGFVHKFSLILFNDFLTREIFVYFSFFVSWIIILIFLNKNLFDSLILIYFFLISILILPILQEYFDPLILLMTFTFFNSKLFLNYRNTIILFLYLLIFLISSNVYYYNLLK